MSIHRSVWAVAVLLGVVASSADAAVIDLIDMGVPTDGVHVMTGYRGYVVRVSGGGAKIRRISMSSVGNVQTEQDAGAINGSISQVWTDPTATGNFKPSPGFSDARNLSPSIMNFDSHLVGDPSHYDVVEFAEYANPGVYPNPLSSLTDTSTKFFDTLPPSYPTSEGIFFPYPSIFAVYDIKPAYQASTLDVAYVVTGSTASIVVNLFYEGAGLGGDGAFSLIAVPEPTVLWALGLSSLLARRRRRIHAMTETLEQRTYLIASPEDVVAVNDSVSSSVSVTWSSVPDADRYTVQRSTNAGSTWTDVSQVGADATPTIFDFQGTVGTTYRVIAIDAGNVSASSPWTVAIAGTPRGLNVQANATPSGITLLWDNPLNAYDQSHINL